MKRLPNFLLMMLTTVLLATFITSCSESGSDSDPSTTPTQPQTPVSDGDWQVVPATGGTIEKGDITITFPSGTFNKDTKIAITEVKKGETCGEYEASKFYQLTTPAKLDKPLSVSIKSAEQADDIRFMTVAQALEKSTYELVKQDVSFDADYSNSKYHFTLPATKNDEDDGNTYLTMGLAHYPSGDDVNGTRTGTRYIMEGQVGNIEWYYEPSWLLTSKQKSLYNRLKPKINQYVIEALKQIQALGFSTRSSRKIPIHFVNDFLFGKDAFGFFEQHTLYDEWNVVKINMCKFSDLYDKDGEEAFLAQLKRTTIHELFHYYQSEYDPRSPIKKAFSPGEENILCEAGSVWIEQFVNDGQLDGNFVSQYLPSYRKSLYNYRECWKLDSENNKTFVKMTAAHGYGMSSLLYYMTSPISEMKGTFGIDKMEIVKLYKKWKTYTTKTFEPLESWLRDYDAWDSFSRYKYDEYLAGTVCATGKTALLSACFFLPNIGFLLSFGGERRKAAAAAYYRSHEIADVVHCVVVFLGGNIISPVVIPAVELELAARVGTVFADFYPAVLERARRHPYSVYNIILRRRCPELSVAANNLDEARRRRVSHHLPYFSATGQRPERGVVFLVGFLKAFLARVKVVLVDPVPHSVLPSPKPHRGRIDGAVVAGDRKVLKTALGRVAVHRVIRHKRIDRAVNRNPFSAHKALVKRSRIKAFVPALHLFGERGIVVHRKMQIERVFLLRLFDPLAVEPVLGVLGVTVEPEP